MNHLQLMQEILAQRQINTGSGPKVESRILIDTRNYQYPVDQLVSHCYSDGWQYSFSAHLLPAKHLTATGRTLFPGKTIKSAGGPGIQFEVDGGKTYIRDEDGFKNFMLTEYSGISLIISQCEPHQIDERNLIELGRHLRNFELITSHIIDLIYDEFQLVRGGNKDNVIWFKKGGIMNAVFSFAWG